MGNQKFRLSGIIPRLWHSARKSPNPFEPPRSPRPQHRPPRAEPESNRSLPIQSFDEMLLLSSSSSRSFRTAECLQNASSSSRSFRTTERLQNALCSEKQESGQSALCTEAERPLPPPIPAQPRRRSVYSNSENYSPRRRKIHTKCCNGVRLKAKSPRINAARTPGCSSSSCSSSMGSEKRTRRPRGLSERSVTVVKSSADPESDFKESMVEMIVENDITDLAGLEELLVSYLVLNSEEFHHVIVSVFKEIVVGLFRKPKKCPV